ncbi:hypothetical protein LguiB_014206 [Lonicera macranthoides]
MDNRLLETARLGNVHLLSQLLQENPLLLSEVFLLSPNENPLHVATKANQLNFVHEIMKIKPELANELNNHGFRPLDIASACGHVEIVKALLVSDAPRLKGREGRTALHYAALKGRVETVELLLGSRVHTTNKLLQLSAMNSKGLTPMDIVDILTESSNNTSIPPKLTKILQEAGALRAKDIAGISPAPVPAVAPPDEHPSNQDWFTYFKFQPGRDPPGETRNALLVMSVLIVTVTFQGLSNPPSLLDKDDTSDFDRSTFLLFNTLRFAAAAAIIEYLTAGFPFQRELRVALFSLGWAYGVVYSTHKGTKYKGLYEALLYIAIFLPMAMRELPKLIRKCFGC